MGPVSKWAGAGEGWVEYAGISGWEDWVLYKEEGRGS